MGRNLTPYMLAGGPILLMVAFFSWPQTSEVGSDATDILFAEDRMPLMMMLAIATIGIVVMFGGLYLLVQQMKGCRRNAPANAHSSRNVYNRRISLVYGWVWW